MLGPNSHILSLQAQRLQAQLSLLLLRELSDRCHNAMAETLLHWV